jgi:hypothetical protein
MDEAHRQTQHRLDLMGRQIIRKITALVLSPGCVALCAVVAAQLSDRPLPLVAAITSEHQLEIDALSRTLACLAAIMHLAARSGFHRACCGDANAQ